jgi:hypothetical protein
MGGENQGVPTSVFHDTMHFKVNAFYFATHVICGILSLLMKERRILGFLEYIRALETMRASPIRPHFAVIMVLNSSLVLVARGLTSYQRHADLFFQAWVLLWQKEGVTNYIHMIASGHIADYLYKWKNLYRFSQQGWEAMNSLIKTFFFRRTSHGGGVRGNSKKSRLIPIARCLQ